MPVMLVTTLLIQSAWADSNSPGQTALSGNSEAQQGIIITGLKELREGLLPMLMEILALRSLTSTRY